MLEVQDLSVAYGDVRVLHGVSLRVGQGEIVSLVGANGAGKTTTLRAVSGLLPALDGNVTFDGQPITGLAPSRIVERGLAHVPEGRQLFTNMTVRENLEMGAYLPSAKSAMASTLTWVTGLFPRLGERGEQLAGTLSGGEQQMLAIGRALMGNPRVLLMDEPSEGLAPQIVAEVGRTIAQLKAEGQSIVLVEQNIKLTLDLADDVVIINTGRVVFRGPAKDIKLDDAIVSQHLGVF